MLGKMEFILERLQKDFHEHTKMFHNCKKMDNVRLLGHFAGGSGWRGRWEGGSGWGRHVNSRTFHFNVWQNSLQIKKNKNKKKNKSSKILFFSTRIFQVVDSVFLPVLFEWFFVNIKVFQHYFCKSSCHCWDVFLAAMSLVTQGTHLQDDWQG